MAVRQPAGARRVATILVAGLALLCTPGIAPAASHNALTDYLQVRELVSHADYDRALELAQRVSDQQSGFLFRNLPEQVLAERILSQGDAAAALEYYQRLTPAGGCLVSYYPSYWNSCQRMADLYTGVGDRLGRIDMLRRLTFGAGTRGSSSPSRTYLQLALEYERTGEIERSDSFHRTVIHCFDSRRDQRTATEELERREVRTGNSDEVILRDALSFDPVLQYAGLGALRRLSDPSAALDLLMAEAADPSRRGPALAVLAELPLPDLTGRLREILRAGGPQEQELAQEALLRATGLNYPFLLPSGEIRGGFDDGSPLAGVWSTVHLMRRVDDPYESERVRLLALDAVGHTADLRGWEAVLRLTAHERPVWRVHALHALRGYGGGQVEEALVNGLQDPDPLARVFAAAGIARRGLADATDLLAEAVAREEEPLVAAALAEALGSQGAGSIGALVDLSRSVEGPAAAKVGEMLALLGDPRGAALLNAVAASGRPESQWAREALQNADAGVATAPATPLLDQLVPRTPTLEPARNPTPDASPEEIFSAAVFGFPPPPGAVSTLLESDRWSEYRGAAIALANAGVRTHLNAIRRRAQTVTYAADGSERVQFDEELIEVLGILQDDGARSLMREALMTGRPGAQAAAARGLGLLGDSASIPLLLAAFSDPGSPRRVRRAAAQSLSTFGTPEIGTAVLGFLESPDPDLRRWTLLLLRDTGSPIGGAQAERVAWLDPDPEIRSLAETIAPDLPR